MKPVLPSDLYVSCTTFERLGKVTSVLKKYPKAQFLNDNNLYPRDLRKVDSSSIDVAPSIMVRPNNAIIVNLLHIKAIIQKDNLKVFDTANLIAANRLGLFMYDLELKLKSSSSLPFEFKALECILISVLSDLEAELQTHMDACGEILAELEDHISRENLQELLIKLKTLTSFYQRAALIRDVLEELLDNDEDLNGMYLTSARNYDPSCEHSDYSDVEMILETYYRHVDEVVQQSGSLISDIKATEDIVNIILDANRNSLMLFELKVTIYTLGFTVATLTPAFYGMNVKNYIEESNYGFGAVIVFSIIQGLFIMLWNFKKLHRVQKLTMMSNTPLSIRGAFLNRSYTGWLWRRRWAKLLYGERRTYEKPTSNERDAIWKMINDDKDLR
ncbi:Mg2+ transporter protein [Metschnikowia bicuspidata]|uniref:Magnesium transporter n=1 Tax=Metschnikowia bicuspidata TaxID=27322 RepID=A0A4P9ZD09_9ASCO|nr:Mg2+ transporter protein [Metschnikowia bicuspidata]